MKTWEKVSDLLLGLGLLALVLPFAAFEWYIMSDDEREDLTSELITYRDP